jgi:hypothetical protein
LPRRVSVDTLKEEAIIDQFHYNTRNLDAIELDSVISLHAKLSTQTPKSEPKTRRPHSKHS